MHFTLMSDYRSKLFWNVMSVQYRNAIVKLKVTANSYVLKGYKLDFKILLILLICHAWYDDTEMLHFQR